MFAALARDVVNQQCVLDDGFDADLRAFGNWYETLKRDPLVARIAAGLVPPRPAIRSATSSLGTVVSIRRSDGFAVSVLPLNAGYHLSTGAESRRETRLTIEVEQVPHPRPETIPKAPPPAGDG